MKRLGNNLFAILPTLAFAGIASADTLIVNCNPVSGSTELVAAAISCGQFNIGGATLSSISIAVSGGITGAITLTNGSTATQSGSGSTTTDFSFAPLSGFSFGSTIFSASFATGIQSIGATTTATFSPLASDPISTGSLGSNTTDFVPYTGNSFFDIFVDTNTLFLGGGSGGALSAAQASQANATAIVTYEYDFAQETPEPATITLFGMGLLGLSFAARKFKVRK